jgi:poly(3-hydroxybutyrate) depolymerase
MNGSCSGVTSEIQALNGTSGTILKTVANTLTNAIAARGLRVANGALDLATLDGFSQPTAAQKFTFNRQSDCSFTIGSQGMCLEAPASAGSVRMVTCNASSTRQKWEISRNADPATSVPNVTIESQSGLCLSTAGGAVTVSTAITAENCQAKPAQQFYLRHLGAPAERSAGTWEKRSINASTGLTLQYRLLLPANYDATISYPVFIWLHQAGVQGSDNEKHMSGTNEVFNQAFVRGRFPAIVIAPQNSAEDTYWENWGSRPSNSQVAVMEILSYIKTQYNVDSKRIYIGGQSDGGMGAFEFSQRWPATFAAIISLSGGGQASTASRIKDIPAFVIHGQDQWTRYSREIVNAVRAVGGTPIYTEITQQNEMGYIHGDWHKIMGMPGTLEWVFSQRKP